MITVARETKTTWGWFAIVDGAGYGQIHDCNGKPFSTADAALRAAWEDTPDGTPALIYTGPKEALT